MENWVKPDFEEIAVNGECTAYANEGETTAAGRHDGA